MAPRVLGLAPWVLVSAPFGQASIWNAQTPEHAFVKPPLAARVLELAPTVFRIGTLQNNSHLERSNTGTSLCKITFGVQGLRITTDDTYSLRTSPFGLRISTI